MTDLKAQQRLLDQRKLVAKAAAREEMAREARDSLVKYIWFTMPHPSDPDDVTLSRYTITPQARLLCQIIEKIARGEPLTEHGDKNAAISIGPQTGKSEIISRRGPAWLFGRNPTLNAILGSYNQDFANEFGDDVGSIIRSDQHRQVFPAHALRKGGNAKDLLISTDGGKLAFVGVGGSGTGKPADVFIVDDPIRNDDDAQSEVYRDRTWNWFTKVASTRIHNESAMVVVHCMTGDTPVLMGSGEEKPLQDVRPGDEVATYRDGELSTSTVRNWASNGFDDVMAITMASGVTIRANGRHPFLVYENGVPKWIRTRDLRRGHEIFRVNGVSGKEKSAREKGAKSPPYAEGTAHRTTVKSVGRTGFALLRTMLFPGTKRALNAATDLLRKNTLAWLPSRMASALFAGSLPARTFALIGAVNSVSITATTPIRSEHYSAMTATLQSDTQKLRRPRWLSPNISDFTLDRIAEIKPAGVEEVFDIQVDETENFIANGLVSHNTRWHEDDLIGRLCDPEHPERGKKYAGVAEDWLHINIPAIVEDPALAKALGLTLRVQQNDLVRAQFGTKPIAALWPERFSLEFLAKQKRLDKRGFTALRMGKPAPEDGDYFKADWLVPYYSMDDLPKRLQMYGSSDHAVTEKRKNDASVIGCVGVDEKDDIWVMPDLIWDRMETDGIVESLLTQFKTHKPLLWWLEDENISKSFGPFLMKRMQEEKTYVTLDGISRITDKRQHARSIQGRLQMKKVHFPVFASWWPDARNEMLKFPFGTHDDFVDFIANVGQGMNKQSMASREPAADNVIKVGSMAWILAQTRKREGKEKRERASASF
jgi:predicted phage terminase large subunit-like protein